MLSYGAAVPSICLLQRFNLLKVVLPLQAAYLEQQTRTKCDQNSLMLMKLFFNLDKVLSWDRPSDHRLCQGCLRCRCQPSCVYLIGLDCWHFTWH